MNLATAMCLAFLAQAQEPASAPPPDIAITARVKAKSLRFTIVPNVKVTFTGGINGVKNATVWKTDRENLPEKVQPNVTYRDIGIRLTITSTLPNIEEILDDALGPASRIAPTTEPRR